MSDVLYVALGGAMGSSLRYVFGLWVQKQAFTSLPLATLGVNVIGSFVMGLVFVWLSQRSDILGLRPLLMAGFLGGFTTFSTFSLDVFALWERGQTGMVFVYVFLSVVLSVLALFAGVFLARTFS